MRRARDVKTLRKGRRDKTKLTIGVALVYFTSYPRSLVLCLGHTHH